MKRYTIRGTRTYEEYVTYTVEANSEEEAIQLVEDGEVEAQIICLFGIDGGVII